MKNYFAPADIVRYTAPYAVNPGDGMLVGGLFGVACTTAASGEKTDVSTEGMYYLTSVSAETAAEGAAAYWDAGNRRVSVTTGTGIGHFPYGKGAGETSTRVRLQASPGSVSGAANSFFSATGRGSALVAAAVPAPWAAVLSSKLTNGVVSQFGPNPTFARDSSGSGLVYCVDDQGLMRPSITGEAISWGLRRERNLCRYPEQLSFTGSNGWTHTNVTVASTWDDQAPSADGLTAIGGTAWTLTAGAFANAVSAMQTPVVLEAVPHVFAVWLKAPVAHNAEIEIWNTTAGSALQARTVAVTTSWQLFYVAGTPDGTSSYTYRIAPATKASAAGAVVYARYPRMHQRVGVTAVPPEFVPRDSNPGQFWSGAGVDGVQYFDTVNASTMNTGTGVVTPVAGSSLRTVGAVSTDMASWARTGVDAPLAGQLATGGTATAYKLVEDLTNGAHHLSTSIPGSGQYDQRRVYARVEVKQAERTWVRLFVNDLDGSTAHYVYVNLATGALGTTTQGDYARVEALADGWYRVTLIAQLLTGSSNAVIRVYGVTADNTPTHQGVAGSGIYLRNPVAHVWCGFGIATFPSYQQFLETRFTTSWALTGLGSITTGRIGPDGTASAIRTVEDSATSAHYISVSVPGTSTYLDKWTVFSVCVKRDGASGRTWARLVVIDLDGTTRSAYVSTATGKLGTVDAGLYLEVEPLAGGWFRAMMSLKLSSTAAGNATVHIYGTAFDNTPSFAGDGANGILLAFPNFTMGLGPGADPTDRAVPLAYAPNITGGAITVPGQHKSYSVDGLLGKTDFGVSSKVTTYFTPGRAAKGGQSQNYSAVTYIRCSAPAETISTFGDYDTVRTGLTIRPNLQNTTHYSKWAFDLYTGNPNAQFVWQPSTVYEVGDIVIPTTTPPNNNPTIGAKKMYTCTQAGVSAAPGNEPVWNTSGFPTVEQTDGTVKWQCNENNGISGSWEPYLGAHQVPEDNTFMATLGCAWFVQPTTYSCYINGIESVKQTKPQLEQGMSTVLPYAPKTLWLGQMGSVKGVPGAVKTAGATDAELMPVYMMFHRDLVVWGTSPTADVVQATSVV